MIRAAKGPFLEVNEECERMAVETTTELRKVEPGDQKKPPPPNAGMGFLEASIGSPASWSWGLNFLKAAASGVDPNKFMADNPNVPDGFRGQLKSVASGFITEDLINSRIDDIRKKIEPEQIYSFLQTMKPEELQGILDKNPGVAEAIKGNLSAAISAMTLKDAFEQKGIKFDKEPEFIKQSLANFDPTKLTNQDTLQLLAHLPREEMVKALDTIQTGLADGKKVNLEGASTPADFITRFDTAIKARAEVELEKVAHENTKEGWGAWISQQTSGTILEELLSDKFNRKTQLGMAEERIYNQTTEPLGIKASLSKAFDEMKKNPGNSVTAEQVLAFIKDEARKKEVMELITKEKDKITQFIDAKMLAGDAKAKDQLMDAMLPEISANAMKQFQGILKQFGLQDVFKQLIGFIEQFAGPLIEKVQSFGQTVTATASAIVPTEQPKSTPAPMATPAP
jgi:hypothetical protein